MLRAPLVSLAKVLVSILAAVVLYVGIGYFSGNVAQVDPSLWRSGQLTGAQIARLVEAQGIASVINLRGPQPGAPWYDAEIEASRKAGVAHYDVPLSARREVTPAEAEALVALMRDAPKPLLIHCEGGADRSGLAAALYLERIAGRPEAAGWQLSPIFGHFPWTGARAMDESWRALSQER